MRRYWDFHLMATSITRLTGQPAYRLGALTLFGAVAVILAALGFEHIGGYEPCELCVQQRYAFYVGIPVLFLALVLVSAGYNQIAAGLFFIVAVGFLANAGLGVYHAGVEWKLWEGPATCGGDVKPIEGAGSMLSQLSQGPVVLCGEAQGRFLGLSFAGWNVIACLGLMFGALKASFATAEDNPTL
jgi:disulfide bond formation protein DsbB